MITFDPPRQFADWRVQARSLLAGGIAPDLVSWDGAGLFGDPLPPPGESHQRRVSADYLKLAETVFMHRDPSRLALLYPEADIAHSLQAAQQAADRQQLRAGISIISPWRCVSVPLRLVFSLSGISPLPE